MKISEQLIAMAKRDLDTRTRLAADGSLFDGYNSEMQAVHEANAAELAAILDAGGWPSREAVGAEAADAAWLVAQHAIGLPDFQRRCLALIAASDAPAWQAAMLEDRIRILEGHEQRYGTAFDWDEDGQMSPQPIEQPDDVDARRAAVGLPPLSETIARHRATSDHRPPDLAQRQRDYTAWLKKVGWR
ncbi:DUF6624 domain-containing protein [Sphingoaurantiacus capsulatus]|uniref:DUF6624 domain-containing protein n=1 Tax=Sphingoaurantiacus capsulatus TaxID=1771310 RepID=A0ABV7XBK7_9SPHN